MSEAEVKALIQKELPGLLAQDLGIRDFIVRSISDFYAGKPETESRFDRILARMDREQEEQNRKWDEFNQEQNRKWEEQNRKWDEQNRKWDEFNREQARKWDEFKEELQRDREEQARKWEEQNHKWEEQNRRWDAQMAENRRLDKKFESTLGALGARWGLNSEASFRNGLRGILQDSFGVEVINLNEFDDDGNVFGEPDQVEIDVIIKNGIVILCEIKSSIDKGGMHLFNRKVTFYEKHHRAVNRKIVISPMVDPRAFPVAERLGIEVYSYADEVENL